jgi:hypothetical protein
VCPAKTKTKIQKYLNWIELNWSKNGFPQLKQFQIKYGVEGFEPRNYVYYWNFSKFAMYFELQFREVKMILNSI